METKDFQPDLVRVVGVVIIDNKAERALVAQRAESANQPLKWEFIGGKVEPGESLVQAVVREVKEETQLEVEPGRILDIGFADYLNIGQSTHQIIFIECRIKSGVAIINNKVYRKIRWAKAEELTNLDWIEADKEFAQNLAVRLT